MANLETIKIIRGSSASCIVRIIEEISGDPYDLTGKTLTGFVSACPDVVFAPEDFEIINAVIGKVRVNFTAAKSLLYKTGVHGFRITVTDNIDPLDIKKIDFENSLEVK